MAVDISWLSVAGAGALSFLSPCILPIVPPYLCYMAGITIEDFRSAHQSGNETKRHYGLIVVALFFVLGFSTVFVALGTSASLIGNVLLQWQPQMLIVAGIMIILMGIHFLDIFRLSFLSRDLRFEARFVSRSSQGQLNFFVISPFIMGLAFAFGWTPCIGPVLGAVLALAGAKETMIEGSLLLLVYSLGLGIPFIVAAFYSAAFMRFLQRFRFHLGRVKKVTGILLIITGILFITGQMQFFSYQLLDLVPSLNIFM